MTKNPKTRAKQHSQDRKKDGLSEPEVKYTGLTKQQARQREQFLISAYTLAYLENARREIARGKIADGMDYFVSIASIHSGCSEQELLRLLEE